MEQKMNQRWKCGWADIGPQKDEGASVAPPASVSPFCSLRPPVAPPVQLTTGPCLEFTHAAFSVVRPLGGGAPAS